MPAKRDVDQNEVGQKSYQLKEMPYKKDARQKRMLATSRWWPKTDAGQKKISAEKEIRCQQKEMWTKKKLAKTVTSYKKPAKTDDDQKRCRPKNIPAKRDAVEKRCQPKKMLGKRDVGLFWSTSLLASQKRCRPK